MLGTILKRKLSDNQVANIFINAIFETVDNGFKEVAQLINEDVAFVQSPQVSEKENGEFGLIVIVGNLSFLESTFDAEQAGRVEKIIFEKRSDLSFLKESLELLVKVLPDKKYLSWLRLIESGKKSALHNSIRFNYLISYLKFTIKMLIELLM